MSTKLETTLDYKTLQQLVTEKIRAAILDGTLKPDQILNQAELAKSLNVSRIPTREALRTLEAEGLIKSQPHRKAVVTTMTREEIRLVYEIRAVLETKAATIALREITLAEKRTMRTLHQKMMCEKDPDRWNKLNNEFHLTLYQKNGTARLLMIIEMLRNWVAGYVRLLVSDPQHRRIADEEHARILEAVEKRNSKKLQSAISCHLRTSCDAVVQNLTYTLRNAG